MSSPDTSLPFEHEQPRTEYTVYSTLDGVVAVISDTDSPCAWIRSDHTVDIEP